MIFKKERMKLTLNGKDCDITAIYDNLSLLCVFSMDFFQPFNFVWLTRRKKETVIIERKKLVMGHCIMSEINTIQKSSKKRSSVPYFTSSWCTRNHQCKIIIRMTMEFFTQISFPRKQFFPISSFHIRSGCCKANFPLTSVLELFASRAIKPGL